MLKSSEEVGGMCGQYEEFVLGHTLCINLKFKSEFLICNKTFHYWYINQYAKNFTEFNTEAGFP